MLIKGELSIETTYELQVNKTARRDRHKKLFSSMGRLRFYGSQAMRTARKLVGSFDFSSVIGATRKHFFNNVSTSTTKMPLSIQKQLQKRVAIFAFALVTVMSLAPSHLLFGSFAYESNTAYAGEIVISDSDGYLTKINPQTNDSDKTIFNDHLTHIVQSGETLSTIAAKYELSTKTLMWENGFYNANSLRAGQAISIPPVDGVTHEIKSGETLSTLAEKYNVDIETIAKQNDLISTSTLEVNQRLFVPGAEGVIPAAPVIPRTTIARTGVDSSARSYVANPNLPNAPVAADQFMIWPTSGKVSQGYRSGHAALDIAKYPGGPIWAACGGTVAKASTGTWGGGYGNHVILDCGNGIKTLYAHMEYLSVSVGDVVGQGQVLGKMGNTGRVYGRTGVHLHFETWKNGVKQNPWNYLQ